jgi:hypothetical protein
VCVLFAFAHVEPVWTQDFPDGAPSAGPDRTMALLERGLPSTSDAWEITAVGVRRFGLADLETHSLALGGGWQSMRGAAGLSRSGTVVAGWVSAAAAVGLVTRTCGAAARGVARRDLAAEERSLPSIEAGAGAWIAPVPGWIVWTSHPQLTSQGSAPPLERGLELGLLALGHGVEVWLVRSSLPGGRADRHRVGGALFVGPVRLAIEFREQPVRASLGISTGRGGLFAMAGVDEHPVLPGTTRWGLSVRGRDPQ